MNAASPRIKHPVLRAALYAAIATAVAPFLIIYFFCAILGERR